MLIFPDQFKKIGKLSSEHKIEVKEDVVPVQLPARNVLEAPRQPMKEELDHVDMMDVIAEVEKERDRCHNLVYVVKSDKSLRSCFDPRNINCWIKCPKYFPASNKDILLTLSKGRYFST